MSTLLVTRQNKNGIDYIVPHNNDHAFLHFTNGSIAIIESRMQELIDSAGLHGWVVNQVRVGEKLPEAPTNIDFIATENIDQILRDYPQTTIQIRGKLSHRVLIPFANSKPLIRLVSVGQSWMDINATTILTVTSIDEIGHTFADKKNPRNRIVNVIDEHGRGSGYRIGYFINNHYLIVGVDRSELVTKGMIEEIQREPSSGILSDNLQDIQELCDDLEAGKKDAPYCQTFATFAQSQILPKSTDPIIAMKDNTKLGDMYRFTAERVTKKVSMDATDAMCGVVDGNTRAERLQGAMSERLRTHIEAQQDLALLQTVLKDISKRLEVAQVQLAGCSVIAHSDTRGSFERATADIAPEFLCPAFDDVSRRVKDCIELREEVESLKKTSVDDSGMIKALKDKNDSLKKEIALILGSRTFDDIVASPKFCAELINKLTIRSHKNNHKWWHDADGNQIDRNKAELLCMVHTEISEAVEGERGDLMDDKLPHRKMVEVELADAVERIFDYAGAFGYDLGGALMEKQAYNRTRADHTYEERAKKNGKRF